MLAIHQRSVKQSEIQRSRWLLETQSVGARQSGEAVGTLHELVAERRPPLGMCREVGNLAHAEPLRVLAADDERERVLEAERRQPFDSGFGVRVAHLVEQAGTIGDRRALEDRRERGPRILHVDVDFAGAQRVVTDERASEAQTTLHR